MTATNHALTGALIGVTLTNPVVAILVAFLSHFVLDAFPHYTDETVSDEQRLRSRKFKLLLIADTVGCAMVVLLLFFIARDHWLIASVTAFVATTPDMFWFPKFINFNNNKPNRQPNIFLKFHHNIQWCTKRWGKWVEILWGCGMIGAITYLI